MTSDLPLFERLLSQSPLSRRELLVLTHTAPTRYKDHYIKKRNGRGRRLISQPTAELKYVQRVLVYKELADLPVHPAAKAYQPGGSIKSHALPHALSRYVLKLDFTDFFPRLGEPAIRAVVQPFMNYQEEEMRLVCRLLCRQRNAHSDLRLSIGAPSSPIISNALMFEFDRTVADYCLANGLIYTRYADDIAISTSVPRVLDRAQEMMESLPDKFRYLNLKYNEAKTVNFSKKHRRVLTGLVLSNDGNASVGREAKRNLRAAVHQTVKKGGAAMDTAHLRGMLAFVYSLDPEWVESLCKRYGITRIADIESDRSS